MDMDANASSKTGAPFLMNFGTHRVRVLGGRQRATASFFDSRFRKLYHSRMTTYASEYSKADVFQSILELEVNSRSNELPTLLRLHETFCPHASIGCDECENRLKVELVSVGRCG